MPKLELALFSLCLYILGLVDLNYLYTEKKNWIFIDYLSFYVDNLFDLCYNYINILQFLTI